MDVTPRTPGLASMCEALADAYDTHAPPPPRTAHGVRLDLEWRARQQAFEAALPASCGTCTQEQRVVWFALRALAAAHVAEIVAVPVYAEAESDAPLHNTPLGRTVTNFEACLGIDHSNADTDVWKRFCAKQLERWHPRFASFRARSIEGPSPGGPAWCWQLENTPTEVPRASAPEKIIVGFFTPAPVEAARRVEREQLKAATLARLRQDQTLPVIDGDAAVKDLEADALWDGNHCAAPLPPTGKLELRYPAATLVRIDSGSGPRAPGPVHAPSVLTLDADKAFPTRREVRYGELHEGVRARVRGISARPGSDLIGGSPMTEPGTETRRALRECYKQTRPGTAREVVSYEARLTIGRRGQVEEITTDAPASALTTCMNEALSRLSFTCPASGARVVAVAACAFRDEVPKP